MRKLLSNLRKWLESFVPVEPTEDEKQLALDRLEEMARPAVFGEIGGRRPIGDRPVVSRWGGDFFGAPDEGAPDCTETGHALHPILQIRIDELPQIPKAFEGIALATIWVDIEEAWYETKNGVGFLIRTYSDLEGLVPLPTADSKLPSFPVFWRDPVQEKPSWEDFADILPSAVATSDTSWYDDTERAKKVAEIQETHPIKLGGWPQWPAESEFVLQVDSNQKGGLNLVDGSSFYIFRAPSGWEYRMDFY